MAVSFVRCVLVASRPGGLVTSAELAPVTAGTDATALPVEVVADRPGRSATIVFGDDLSSDAFTGDARHDAFDDAVVQRLRAVGAWVMPRAPAVRALASAGVAVELLIELWLDQDQLDLHLPVELLAALGAAGVGVYVLSNE